MGNADGLLVGLALLAGLTAGVPGVLLAGLVAFIAQALRRQPDLPRLLLILLVALTGAGRALSAAQPPSAADLRGSTAAIGRVVSMPVYRDGGQRFLLRVESYQRDKTWADADVTVYVSTRESHLNVGDRTWVAWQVEPVGDLEPGLGGYVQSLGATASAYVFAVRLESIGSSWQRGFVKFRAALGTRLHEAAPGDAGALLAGMVTGDDGQLARATRDQFRVTQTSHITAVSGSNLSMVAGLWAVLGVSGALRRRWWYQALVACTIIGYAVLVGLEPPAVRATVVTLLALLSIRFGRRPEPLTLLTLTAAGMAMVDPAVTGSLGFQLSMASSVALVACLPDTALTSLSRLRSSMLAVLCAQLATLPLLITAFGAWSPIGIVANIMIAPLVPVATYFGAIAAVAGLIWAPLGNLLGWLAAWPAAAILAIVHRWALVARPLPLAGSGDVGLLVIAVIAAGALIGISPESRRFAGDMRVTWFRTPSDVALAAGSCLAGLMLALMLLFALG